MNPADPDMLTRLWVALRIAALAPAVLVLVPLQWVLLRLEHRWSRAIPMLFHRYVLRVLGVRVHLTGKPSVDRPLLIVSNHVSWLDISVIGSRFPLSFIAKSEVATWPLFGLFAKLQRSVFVDRQRPGKTHEVNGEIARRLAAGEALVLFGEGTTSDGSRILPFRSALLGATQVLAMNGEARPARVQSLCIAYTKIQGLPMGRADRPLIAWYGDMEMAGHLFGVLASGAIDCTLAFGEPIAEAALSDRKRLARHMETVVRGQNGTALTGRPPVPQVSFVADAAALAASPLPGAANSG